MIDYLSVVVLLCAAVFAIIALLSIRVRNVGMHLVFLTPFYLFACFVLAFIVRSTGPEIEERLFPILGEQRVEDVRRAGGRLCWRWAFVKLRRAVPDSAVWAIEAPGYASNVIVSPLVERLAERHAINYCIVLPEDAPRSVTVRGTIRYRSSHGLWLVEQNAAPVIEPRTP